MISAATLEPILQRAIDAATKAGATYADARVVLRRHENISSREDHLSDVDYDERYGLGVRVLCAGAWGFCASARVDAAEAAHLAATAVAMARANAKVLVRPVTLAPAPAARDRWSTQLDTDPFTIPLDEKVGFLSALWPRVHKIRGVKFLSAFIAITGDDKVFASSDGSFIEQSQTRVNAGYDVTAADTRSGDFASRSHELPPRQAGWEYLLRSSLHADAPRMAEEAVEKLHARTLSAPRRIDTVLAPSNLYLTIHESVGHPLELDRILGWEANYAGTSFVTVENRGKLRFAAPHLTFYADKTTPGGLATCGYDDDGARTQKWDLIKNGTLVGFETTRDLAQYVGEPSSRGTSYAEDHESFPFQRMPNVSLEPAKEARTLADLIAAVDDGIYMSGIDSWSIDQQRYNLQLSGQMCREIKHGKLGRALRNVAYQSRTLDFWNACALTGGPATWELHGALEDGKGEPSQSNPVSHGCPPALFRRLNVIPVGDKA